MFVFVWVFALFFEIGFCCNVFGFFAVFYKKNSGCGCLARVKGNEGGSLGFLRLRCFFFPSSVCGVFCVFLCSFFRSGLLRAFWVWLVCFLGVDVLA